MKYIKKVSATPLAHNGGDIIDSFNTGDDKTINAPSIHAVEEYVADNKDETTKTTFTFKDTLQNITITAKAYKYGKVITIYFDLNLQAGSSGTINISSIIPNGYKPAEISNLRLGSVNSANESFISLFLTPGGTITGFVSGANNESGSYSHEYPVITYVAE